MPESVNRGGIDPVHATIERSADGGNRLVAILRSPGERPSSAAHRPRPHADRGQVHIAVAKLCLLHLFYNNQVDPSHKTTRRRHRLRTEWPCRCPPAHPSVFQCESRRGRWPRPSRPCCRGGDTASRSRFPPPSPGPLPPKGPWRLPPSETPALSQPNWCCLATPRARSTCRTP